MLKAGAIPSIFCNCPCRLTKCGRSPLVQLNVSGDHQYASTRIHADTHADSCPMHGFLPKRRAIPKPPQPPKPPKPPKPRQPPKQKSKSANILSEAERPASLPQAGPRKMSKAEEELRKENEVLHARINELSKKIEETSKVDQARIKTLQEREEWWKGRFGSDQIAAAQTGNSKGREWSIDSVIKGLRIRASGGSSGLKSSSVELFPLPGERTLQRRTKNVTFAPGVQHQILDAFAEELKRFDEDDFDCILSFDDCSIKSRVDFDSGTQSYIGHVTLPNVQGLATKATIWVFAGVRRKWKVTAAYHFVPSEGCPDEVYAVLLELLQKALDLKLNVLGFVCDMANRGLLKKFGFSFKKNDIKYRVEHPLDKTKQLFCIPDMVHLY